MNSKDLLMIGNIGTLSALSRRVLVFLLLIGICYGMFEQQNSAARARIQENREILEPRLWEIKRNGEPLGAAEQLRVKEPNRGAHRGKQLTMEVSAYTCGPESTGKNVSDPGYCLTASGYRLRPGDKVVAMGKKYPFGTLVMIPGYGLATVRDRGGAIEDNHVDLYFERVEDALKWGRKMVTVTIVLNTGRE